MLKRLMMGIGLMLVFGIAASAEEPGRWFHVRVVDSGTDSQTVRINVPFEVAEKVLPAIHTNELHDGKVNISGKVKDVDLHQLIAAVRNAPDNEYVTVEQKDQKVRVAKEKGYLLVHVIENKGTAEGQTVEVKVPMPVVEALLSGGGDELDVLAALRALKPYGDLDLVTVKEKNQTVRIWIDSKSTPE